jgi:probable addiction module antidote protein
MKPKLTKWDAAECLKTKEHMVEYLNCALEDGDPAFVAAALGDIARAQGMTGVASASGLGRESLYRTLSRRGNPAFSTVIKVAGALGLRLRATAAV